MRVELSRLVAPESAEDLFRQYVEAQNLAKETLSLKDGLIAGRAWGRFIRAFDAPDRRDSWPKSFSTSEPDEFMLAALHYGILKLEVARDAMLAGKRAEFITGVRMHAACLSALIETIPEVDRFEERS